MLRSSSYCRCPSRSWPACVRGGVGGVSGVPIASWSGKKQGKLNLGILVLQSRRIRYVGQSARRLLSDGVSHTVSRPPTWFAQISFFYQHGRFLHLPPGARSEVEGGGRRRISPAHVRRRWLYSRDQGGPPSPAGSKPFLHRCAALVTCMLSACR